MKHLSHLEYKILDILRLGHEFYGLEMVNVSGGALKRGSIYVTLSRMERKGYIASRQMMEQKTSGLPRRIYRICGLGQQILSATDVAQSAFDGGQFV